MVDQVRASTGAAIVHLQLASIQTVRRYQHTKLLDWSRAKHAPVTMRSAEPAASNQGQNSSDEDKKCIEGKSQWRQLRQDMSTTRSAALDQGRRQQQRSCAGAVNSFCHWLRQYSRMFGSSTESLAARRLTA